MPRKPVHNKCHASLSTSPLSDIAYTATTTINQTNKEPHTITCTAKALTKSPHHLAARLTKVDADRQLANADTLLVRVDAVRILSKTRNLRNL